MTPDETAALTRIIFVAFDRPIPNGLAEVWHATLDDIPFELARTAALDLIRISTFTPKVAEIRARATEIHHQRRKAIREAGERRAIEAYAADAGPLTDRRAEIRGFVDQVRGALPEGDREALHPRRVHWEREHQAYERQQTAEPNPHFDPTLDTPPTWQVNAGTENGAWWEDDRARERHAQELLSAAGRLRPRTTRETS